MYRTKFFLKRNDRYSTEVIYAIKHCIRPSSTKVYKDLVTMFDKGEIAGYGWTRK